MVTTPYQRILFAQHGMADNNEDMAALAYQVALPQSLVIAPSLGFVNTYFNIDYLIKIVENEAKVTLAKYPDLPARIIATSLGGVLWVEVLTRNPEWWNRFESLVLLGSPIGGADLARIIDPFGWGIGIAKALGQSRRSLAEQITAVIPTLVVAGDTTGGNDGTVTVESTKLKHAHFICLNSVHHAALKTHPEVAKVIQEFWSQPRYPLPDLKNDLVAKLIEHFRAVPGITDASSRDFLKAKNYFQFKDGTSLWTWKSLAVVNHIFVADSQGNCEYSGFVGWIHTGNLESAIKSAIQKFNS